jgi:hypothetical protein
MIGLGVGAWGSEGGMRLEPPPKKDKSTTHAHATALQRGGPARRDLAVGGDRRARIVRGGGDDDHGRRGGEEADGEGE